MGRVTIAIANQGQKAYDTEEIKDWEPLKVSYLGDIVLFQVEGDNDEGEKEMTQYSMSVDEYNSVFA